MNRTSLIPWAGGMAVAIAVAAPMTGCLGDDTPCLRDSLGDVVVFLEGGEEAASATFTGEVTGILPPDDSMGFRRYRIRDVAERIRTVVFQAPSDSLPVRAGQTYTFRIETVPGMPTPCGVAVLDDGGLLFAAVSDYAPGERIFTDGLPEFTVSLETAGCGNRKSHPCLSSDVNGVLRFETGDAAEALHQGESAAVGSLAVTCLSARFVTYSDTCADFVVFGVGYTVRRYD